MAGAAEILNNIDPVHPIPPPPPGPIIINQGPIVGGPTEPLYDPRFDEVLHVMVETAPVHVLLETAPIGAVVSTAKISARVSTSVESDEDDE